MRITLLMPAAAAARRDEPVSAPLGVAYLAAILRRNGHQVGILDAATLGQPEQVSHNRWRIGADETSLAGLAINQRPDLIGVSCPFTTRYAAFRRLVSALRTSLPQVPIVAGGIHPTILPREVLSENAIDCIVLGEGESTFSALVNRFAETGKIAAEDLDGVAFLVNGEPVIRPKQSYILDLDTIPDPARDLLDIKNYLRRSGGRWSSPRSSILSIITSRSCPGRCSFCSIHAVFGPHWRARSPERVVAEIESVMEEFNPTMIAFEDDRLTLDRERLIRICEGIASQRKHVRWFTPNGVHVADLDLELLKVMRDSGCRKLNLAIESGDQEMLQRNIGKKATADQARFVARTCARIGIRTNGYFVLGMPGETEQSLQNSLDLCLSLPLDGLGVFTATPFPGTRLFAECAAKGYIDPKAIMKEYYDATDSELLHKPLFETETLSRERLIWWSGRFREEFNRRLYRRRPLLRVKAALKRLTSPGGPS